MVLKIRILKWIALHFSSRLPFPSQVDHVSWGLTSRDVAFSCSMQVNDIPGVLVDPLLVLVEHVNLHWALSVSQRASWELGQRPCRSRWEGVLSKAAARSWRTPRNWRLPSLTAAAGCPSGGSHASSGPVLCLVVSCDPTDCSPPGSSIREILQARKLERVAMPSSRGPS